MLNQQELDKVVEYIRAAESKTSAEIRVCVVKKCKDEPFDAAYRKFKALKMDTTLQHNSVLLFVAPDDHKVAIVADSGINDAAKENFWGSVLDDMLSYFKNGEICDGICRGVGKVGELIKSRYPIQDDDINELSDDVILDEE